MDSTITTSIITGVVAIIVAYLSYLKIYKQHKIDDAVREQRQLDHLDKIDEKIATLTKKVDEHNHYAEKLGSIAVSLAAMSKDIEYLKTTKK